MSYNVTTFNVKETNNFRISIIDVLSNKALHHYNFALQFDGDFKLCCSESTITLSGETNGEFNITDMSIMGESSGYIFEDVVVPLLKKTKGTMKSMIVWEGGDSVEKIEVDNGTVRRDEITI